MKRSSTAFDGFEEFEGSAQVTHVDSYTAGPYTDSVQLVTTMFETGESVSFVCSPLINHLQPVQCVWENTIVSMEPSHLTNPEATTVNLNFGGVDIDRFMCQLDGGPWEVCTSPRQVSRLAPGNHTFSVKGFYDDSFVPASSDAGSRHLLAHPAQSPAERYISWEIKPNFELPGEPAELNVTIPQEETLQYPITGSAANSLQCTVKAGSAFSPNCQRAGNKLLITVKTNSAPTNENGTYSAVLVLRDKTAEAVGVISELELNFKVNVWPQVRAHAVINHFRA